MLTHEVSENNCGFLDLNFVGKDYATSARINGRLRGMPHPGTVPEPCWAGASAAPQVPPLRGVAAARTWGKEAGCLIDSDGMHCQGTIAE